MRKQKGGNPIDMQPVSMLHEIIEINGVQTIISDHIDHQIKNIFLNKLQADQNNDKMKTYPVQIRNKEYEILITQGVNKRMPEMDIYYKKNPDAHTGSYDSCVQFEFRIPFYKSNDEEKSIAEACTYATSDDLASKIEAIIGRYKAHKIKAKIMKSADNGSYNYIFLHHRQIILCKVSTWEYRGRFREVAMNIYYASADNRRFYGSHINESSMQNKMWTNVYDYMYDDIQSEIKKTHTESPKASPNRSRISPALHKMPDDMIDTVFNSTYHVKLSAADVAVAIERYQGT
jgi:hypothetical protein